MSTRGWKTLEDIGLEEAIQSDSVDKRGMTCQTELLQKYGKDGRSYFR
jgi:hypothetical protein